MTAVAKASDVSATDTRDVTTFECSRWVPAHRHMGTSAYKYVGFLRLAIVTGLSWDVIGPPREMRFSATAYAEVSTEAGRHQSGISP